jgi:hypothetical protein
MATLRHDDRVHTVLDALDVAGCWVSDRAVAARGSGSTCERAATTPTASSSRSPSCGVARRGAGHPELGWPSSAPLGQHAGLAAVLAALAGCRAAAGVRTRSQPGREVGPTSGASSWPTSPASTWPTSPRPRTPGSTASAARRACSTRSCMRPDSERGTLPPFTANLSKEAAHRWGLGGGVEAKPGPVGQVDDPLGPEHRREGAKHAW